jgi:hypothetical protein
MPNATPTPIQIIIQKLVMLLFQTPIFFETNNMSNPSQEEEKKQLSNLNF